MGFAAALLFFSLQARFGGVLERSGHTEATVDLMRLAGLKSFGALCGPTKPDGGMARLPDVADFGLKRDFPVIIVANLIFFRNQICGGGYERTR